MGSANLETVRAIYEAWDRGDYSSADWADPEIEYVLADGPSRGEWSGHEGMAEGWRDFLSAWDDFQTRVEEIREVDDDRVVSFVRFTGRGKASGLEAGQLTTESLAEFTFRDGKVKRFVIYWEREYGLEQLGLKPGS